MKPTVCIGWPTIDRLTDGETVELDEVILIPASDLLARPYSEVIKMLGDVYTREQLDALCETVFPGASRGDDVECVKLASEDDRDEFDRLTPDEHARCAAISALSARCADEGMPLDKRSDSEVAKLLEGICTPEQFDALCRKILPDDGETT